MVRIKLKHILLQQFGDYNNYTFIGHYIEAKYSLVQRIIKTLEPEQAEKEIESILTIPACLPELTRNTQQYRSGIKQAVTGLWNGTFDLFEFVDAMTSTLRVNLTAAWHEGAKECNITPDELSQEERTARDDFWQNQIQYLIGFGEYIEANSKANGGKLSDLDSRIDLWANRWEEAKTLGAAMACADEKRQWHIGPTETHCRSCKGLDGRVYRYSVWLKNDALPRSSRLACNGYRCQCRLDETSNKITSGKFPTSLLG